MHALARRALPLARSYMRMPLARPCTPAAAHRPAPAAPRTTTTVHRALLDRFFSSVFDIYIWVGVWTRRKENFIQTFDSVAAPGAFCALCPGVLSAHRPLLAEQPWSS